MNSKNQDNESIGIPVGYCIKMTKQCNQKTLTQMIRIKSIHSSDSDDDFEVRWNRKETHVYRNVTKEEEKNSLPPPPHTHT